MAQLPSIRWGIVATGLISEWFVKDLILSRPDAKVHHIIQAIGSSSTAKGSAFAAKHCPESKPAIYDSYHGVYEDPDVDLVYIGTPHSFHKQNCLDAIAAGKPILCEKAFALNARDALQVFEAAKEKNVYVAEAMWLRHRPLVQDLRKLLHEDKVIGEVLRSFSDFGIEKDITSLPETSRYKDPALGAGSLLDLGVYALTWASIALDATNPHKAETPTILASQTHHGNVEVATSIILKYPSTGRQAIVTSTTNVIGNPDLLTRIEGSNGSIEVTGLLPSFPTGFRVYPKFVGSAVAGTLSRAEGKLYDYPVLGKGYHFEADNTALDVLAGRLESSIMPWSETVRMMEVMDEVRRQGGTVYAGDLA
ncbi:dimeric dihydrodiol dehydrogenase [Dactylonectria macrodidyma]|uniref:D-xylose 1-dehydrogenase (NADP(+), D-xylono-1,5-lactone-forming) n=1 Tax=Dactylonectria macrodidyma TaxID=307937 RepID=A0A9P9F8D7_9HYPO|nr:dimeric dihydrodiol dehydrogenase [Dactylonectria macrodidyma]